MYISVIMFLIYNPKKIVIFFAGIVLFGLLNSCGIWDPADARKVSPNADERVKKNLEEGRGVTLGGLMGGNKNTPS